MWMAETAVMAAQTCSAPVLGALLVSLSNHKQHTHCRVRNGAFEC